MKKLTDATLPLPKTIGSEQLMKKSYEPIRYVVPGFVAEGCTLLVGAPKSGKSWLCLEIALAVASGGQCLGNVQCKSGEVLYLALEDNERRLHSRMMKLLTLENVGECATPDGIEFAFDWHREDQGGTECIRRWLDEHPRARLVVIDVLAIFKSKDGRREKVLYNADYESLRGLQQLAADRRIAILVVHHTRKAPADIDPFDSISGTNGLSGAADTALVLCRTRNGTIVYGRGREIEEIESALDFDHETCRWRITGPATDARSSSQRAQIQALLKNASVPMTPKEIADTLGKNGDAVRQLLSSMARAGEVDRKEGRYSHPDHIGHNFHAGDHKHS